MNPTNFFDNGIVEEVKGFQIPENMVFIFGDVETTGLSENTERMTEIALIRTNNKFEETDKYVNFINPERKISAKITELTGITEEMVADAMIYEEAVPDIKEWWNQNMEGKHIVFVAHNAPFDTKFINRGSQDILKEDIVVDWIDTVSLARELYPFWKNHKLDTCAEKFDIANDNHHRAENDTVVLMEIGIRLIKEFVENGNNPINFRTSKSLHYKK